MINCSTGLSKEAFRYSSHGIGLEIHFTTESILVQTQPEYRDANTVFVCQWTAIAASSPPLANRTYAIRSLLGANGGRTVRQLLTIVWTTKVHV